MKELHGTHESAYEYDGASRRWRITEKENGTQTKQETFVWCGSRICQKRSGSTVTRSYFGNGFQESGSTNYFTTRDHLGSVREVVASDGTTVASRLSYDPWGKATETGSGAKTDFTYTGHYYDRPTGLTLAPYRGYDPGLGRWLSLDLLGLAGGLNLYGYVDNDPANALDPLGLSSAPTREELTFIAELLGVGNTAALINEHDAMLSAAARGDADGVDCHGRKAAEATIKGVGEFAVLGIMSGGGGGGPKGPIAGGGAKLSHIKPSEARRIQNAATRIGKPIHLVGSRAGGTATLASDWDYIIMGASGRERHSIVNSLPGAALRDEGIPNTVDFLSGPLDAVRPYITFLP